MPIAAIPLFCREYFRTFKTTGAILPSGKPLANALVRPLMSISSPRVILEAGPGTGAVTEALLRLLAPEDRLILCEINSKFADYLEGRLLKEPLWAARRNQIQIVRDDVRRLLHSPIYHFIVSGLPLNNFSPTMVEDLLEGFLTSLKPQGVHTFFEYMLVREARMKVGRRSERERMLLIHQAVVSKLYRKQWRRSAIFWNVPPAWAYTIKQAD